MTGWLEGESICPEELICAPDGGAVAKAGTTLARLHADPFRPTASVEPDDDARALSTVAEDLVALDAGLAQAAGKLGREVAAELGDAQHATTLVHGDFSADQVVLTADGPVIIDWDLATCGDPARDLGSFLARLDAQAVDSYLARTEADDLGAALLEGYARKAGTPPASTGLHHARGLLMLASEGSGCGTRVGRSVARHCWTGQPPCCPVPLASAATR